MGDRTGVVCQNTSSGPREPLSFTPGVDTGTWLSTGAVAGTESGTGCIGPVAPIFPEISDRTFFGEETENVGTF